MVTKLKISYFIEVSKHAKKDHFPLFRIYGGLQLEKFTAGFIRKSSGNLF
ncbi:hypothetical protein [Flavobacterium sp. 245]|nr:hypothetical protein [Flavobacterium sp. 245]